ncbi:AMP-binding protein [Pseudofrankia inefficax]|uniref:AMP-dependent synthetase and ligase n=1 Tax=Pseudofrankia inefficax (strain DSM 45817 / CECT 9037 / DDB 130130 / EuI1c) TaxID=298654 RepID=E3ITT8_PSEI1|nr:AMP-binding protein [Pseudofrankia inefficax]ADP79985.1 AMP-dependent synthetase and ligase [Pseudofrankia inefficax]
MTAGALPGSGPRPVNFADMLELVAGAVPDRPALVAGAVRLTFGELDARVDRAARLLRGAGVRPGDHVGLYATNRAEWVESMFACMKLRATSININFRYVVAELRYLVDNADLVALVVERRYLPTVAGVLADAPALRLVVVLEDGTDPADDGGLAALTGPGGALADRGIRLAGYEDTPAVNTPADDSPVRVPRSGDDRFILYTGGTTGMPKGVIWRHEDLFHAAIGRPLPDGSAPRELADILVHTASPPLHYLVMAPLMHGAAELSVLISIGTAGTILLWCGRHFDPHDVLRLAADERASTMTVVGDAMARPLADALAEAPGRYDLSGLLAFSNTGAPMSPRVRADLAAALPNVFLLDSYGASEFGHNGSAEAGGKRLFQLTPDTLVLDERLEPVAPGSPEPGRIARRGNIPLGYYKDEAKTASTFLRDARGVRWVVPGDLALVRADGTVELLGRGSAVVNTGGEKVFPDEVEDALKSHGAVFDTAVVGVPDERYGERVVALVALREASPGGPPTVADLIAHTRQRVAGYKVPKEIHLVDVIARNPAGKPDTVWARTTALRLSLAAAEAPAAAPAPAEVSA